MSLLCFTPVRRRVIVAAIFFITGLVNLSAGAQPPATLVGVDTVQRESLSQTIPVLGRVVALQSGVVAARTNGPVAELPVEVGDHIGQNDIIAVLDQARLRARVAQQATELDEFKARLATAKANETLARLELDRLEKLRNTAAFNQSLYDNRTQELAVAISNRQEAEARIARGQVNLELAQIELQDGTIRAPYPGVVTLTHTSEGAWLEKGDPVVTLVNDQDLEIEADVSTTYVGNIALGDRIPVLLEDGSRHRARVRAVIPDENPAARTRPVRLVPDFAPTSQRLAINQPVTLELPVSRQASVVSVHKDAVLRQGDQATVYVVRDGVARSRTVQLGEAVGSRFQVLEGLQPGDVVVTRGNERLQPGQRVQYPEQPPAVTAQPG